MSSQKALANRIKSIGAIKQVSKSMEIVSIVKYERIKKTIAEDRELKQSIENIAAATVLASSKNNKFIQSEKGKTPETIGLIVMGSDRGLCGGYNISVIKKAKAFALEQNKKLIIYPVGKKVISSLSKFPKSEIRDTEYVLHEQLLNATANSVGSQVLSDYLDGLFDEVWVIYSRAVSIMQAEPTVEKLLPLSKEDFKIKDGTSYKLEPNAEDVLMAVVPKFLEVKIATQLTESLFSEHLTRRITMKNAIDNAEEALETLDLKMKKERQARITQEVSEIAANMIEED